MSVSARGDHCRRCRISAVAMVSLGASAQRSSSERERARASLPPPSQSLQGKRMVALAAAAMLPSSRPGESEPLAGGGLDRDPRHIQPGGWPAIRARIASRCGPTFGRSQISVTSGDARDASAAGGDAVDRVFQLNLSGGGALPLRVARRKMRTGYRRSATARRGWHRPAQVQPDVAVGMRQKAAVACGTRRPQIIADDRRRQRHRTS